MYSDIYRYVNFEIVILLTLISQNLIQYQKTVFGFFFSRMVIRFYVFIIEIKIEGTRALFRNMRFLINYLSSRARNINKNLYFSIDYFSM